MNSKSRMILASAVVCAGCSMPRRDAGAGSLRWSERCDEDPAIAASRVAAPDNIERVEPLYGTMHSAYDGQVSRLVGAKLHLRPIEGATSESITRALYCHAATKTVRGDDGCPYGLRDESIDIAVQFDPPGYMVTLEGHDFEQAKEILARARAYARR